MHFICKIRTFIYHSHVFNEPINSKILGLGMVKVGLLSKIVGEGTNVWVGVGRGGAW